MSASAGIFGIGFVTFVLVWFQPQKLFLDKTVNEPLPGANRTNSAGAAPGGIAGNGSAGSTPASTATRAGPSPAPELKTLVSGSFRSLEHATTGTAFVLQERDGKLILRLENLDTSNGPDLRIYLSQIPAGDDWHAYGERFLDLGPLKGNRGNQNYAIRAATDLSKFKSAVIWCRRFRVGFAVAGLSA